MRKLILLLCIAMSGNVYGQTYQENKLFRNEVSDRLLNLHDDLGNIQTRLIKKGDIISGYRVLELYVKTEHILTLLHTVNSLGFIFEQANKIGSKSKENMEIAVFSMSVWLVTLEMLEFQLRFTLSKIEKHIDNLDASGPIVLSALRDELRGILKVTKKLLPAK